MRKSAVDTCQVSKCRVAYTARTRNVHGKQRCYAPANSLGVLDFFVDAIATEGNRREGLSGEVVDELKREKLACDGSSTIPAGAGARRQESPGPHRARCTGRPVGESLPANGRPPRLQTPANRHWPALAVAGPSGRHRSCTAHTPCVCLPRTRAPTASPDARAICFSSREIWRGCG